MYTVTRQSQWPEGNNVVEVSFGGINYTNPDALVEKYPGEFQEFDNPIEAVETAINICRAWRQDGTKDATVGIGGTGGYTMPFESTTFKDAIAWSKKELESLEKCPSCGEIMQDREDWYVAGIYYANDFLSYNDGEKYCSSNCADKNSEFETEDGDIVTLSGLKAGR